MQATTITQGREDRTMAHVLESGFWIEAVGGAVGAILAIIGLARTAPTLMLPISCIILGGVLMLQGGFVAAEYNKVLSRFEGVPVADFGGALGVEVVTGFSASFLAVVSLFDVAPQYLMGAAAFILGEGLVLSAGVASRLNALKAAGTAEARPGAGGTLSGVSYLQILAGLAAMILGVLALANLEANPTAQSLGAMLFVGAAMLLSGGSTLGRIMSLFH